MPSLDTDRALLDAFRRGDQQALTEVYYEHIDDIALVVRRGFVIESQGHRFVPGAKTLDEQHELLQEVFVRAFADRARLAYDGLRPYGPYLARIAKNLLIDRLRARSHVSLDELKVGDGELDAPPMEVPSPDPELDAEQRLHQQGLTEATQAYLAGLDDEARTFVRLRFEEERSQDEIAAQMNVSRRRVRTLEERVESGLLKYLKSIGLSAA